MPNCNAKNYLKRKSDPKKLFFYLRFDLDMNIVEGINGKIFLSSTNSSTTYKQIKKAKCQLFEWGYLHYDDAYFFANYYLKKFPAIKKILQKRFRFVFVDEMQDMDKHQYEILEKIFYLKKKEDFDKIIYMKNKYYVEDCSTITPKNLFRRLKRLNTARTGDKQPDIECWLDKKVREKQFIN